MKKTIVVMMTLALLSGFAVAQEKVAPAAPAAKAATNTSADADPVVIRFGSNQVRKSELEMAMESLPDEYKAYVAGPGKRAFAEDYIRMKMLAADAEKNGLDKKPEVRAQLQLMRDNTLATAQLKQIEESVKLSDADVQKIYTERKGDMEQVKARHILIAFKGSPAAREGKDLTDEQAKAKAEEIRKKLVGGADFAELAKKESDDVGSGGRGGDLGAFGRGQMVPEFDKAAFEAKIGEITPVVKTQFGYHVIQVQERGARPIAEVRPELERELKQVRVRERLDSMKKTAAPTFDEAYFTPPAAPAAPAASAPTGGTEKKQ